MIKKIKNISLKDIKDCLYLFISICLYPFYSKKYNDSWLISERLNSAQDNGWIFYRWLKNNHPNQMFFLCLNKDTIYKMHLEKDKRVIVWGSLKHYLIYLSSKILIKTTFLTPRPSNKICLLFEKIFKKEKYIVYLRHGISKDGVELHHYNVQHARLFICGAKPEYDYIKENAGYPDGYVQYTGFARFDDLVDKKVKDRFVLFIPTWRRYIEVTGSQEGDENNFLQSTYFKHIHHLLCNSDFIDILEEYNYKLKFVLHATFQKYITFFGDIDKRVILEEKDKSIHDLLKETSFLLTDYSSVFFDAAYMKKPMIFYQFDYDEFRKKHFSEGYFSYINDGMGPVVNNEKELIETIKSFYNGKKFVNKMVYIKRCERFFPIIDKNNCLRIYNLIKSIDS